MPRKILPSLQKQSAPSSTSKTPTSTSSTGAPYALPRTLVPTPETILRLQQTVGNRAVTQWLKHQNHDPVPSKEPIQGVFKRSKKDPNIFIDLETKDEYVLTLTGPSYFLLKRVKDGFKVPIDQETLMPLMETDEKEVKTKETYYTNRRWEGKKKHTRTITKTVKSEKEHEDQSSVRLGLREYKPLPKTKKVYLENKDSNSQQSQDMSSGDKSSSTKKRRNVWENDLPEQQGSFTQGDDVFNSGNIFDSQTNTGQARKKRKKGGKDRVINAPKLSTPLTVAVALIPKGEGRLRHMPTLSLTMKEFVFGEGENAEMVYFPEHLVLAEVQMGSKDRPNTRFGTDQEAHTVAWTAQRQAILGLQNRALHEVIKICYSEFLDLEKLEQIPEAETLINEVKILNLETLIGAEMTLGSWQGLCSNLIRIYVQSYQLSKGATFSKGKKNQRGEKGGRDLLLRCEKELVSNTPLTATVPQMTKAAESLLEITFQKSLGEEPLAFAVNHWMQVLEKICPSVMKAHGNAIVKDILARKPGGRGKKKNVQELMEKYDYERSTPDFSEVKTPQFMITQGGLENFSFTNNLPVELKSNFTAYVQTEVVQTGSLQNFTFGFGNQNSTSTFGQHQHSAEHLLLKTVLVSDQDRPKTKFNSKQKSHTVAWTLVRNSLMALRGKSVASCLNILETDFKMLSGDFGSPTGQKLVDQSLEKITENRGKQLRVEEWDNLLSHLIRAYATAYNKSQSATYVTSEGHGDAHGHAEGTHMPRLLENEYALQSFDNLKDSPESVIESAVALLDASVNLTLSPTQYAKAVVHWLEALRRTCPKLMQGNYGGRLIEEKVFGRSLGKIYKVTNTQKKQVSVKTVLALMNALYPDHITK